MKFEVVHANQLYRQTTRRFERMNVKRMNVMDILKPVSTWRFFQSQPKEMECAPYKAIWPSVSQLQLRQGFGAPPPAARMPPLVSELKEKFSENRGVFGKTLPGCLTSGTENPCTKSKLLQKTARYFPAKHSRHSAFYGIFTTVLWAYLSNLSVIA